MRQIVLDTETTGLKVEEGHRIVEIAAIVLQHRSITQETFQCYLNPERKVDPNAYAIHRLSNDFLKNKPTFVEIAPSFLKFIASADELIIHNAPFDLAFLNHELTRVNPYHRLLETVYKVTDSLVLARKKRPNQRNTLDALCKEYLKDYQVDRDRKYHSALLDTQLLAQVYLELTRTQRSFFENLEQIADQNPKKCNLSTNKIATFDLPIRYANELELGLHQEHLKTIQRVTDNCLWEE